MAGTFIVGETKVRPGVYFNIQKTGDNAAVGADNGVVAVLFKSDFGPLCTATEIAIEEGYETYFGTALTTDALREAFAGGARKIIACRLGKGGTEANVKLKNTGEAAEDVVAISARYPGAKDFSVTVRDKLSNQSLKECIIYSGTKEFEKVEFEKGSSEVEALVSAFSTSKNFVAQKTGDGELANVSQATFVSGTNPTTTNDEYSAGFAAVEPFEFNTLCVDTEETAVHLLMQSFMDRIFEAGQLVQGVVAEKQTIDLETRMKNAAAFNDEKMNYVLNAKVSESGLAIDGYQTAARVAGMIASCASNTSLTHTVLAGITELYEKLTPTETTKAELSGCIVLSYSAAKQVWIDSAINTLITPADNQDDGWKKIRRVKTRFELIRRVNKQVEALIGKVDNDSNGRATVVSQIQGIGTLMVEEGKLVSCAVAENSVYVADGDSAWFDIDVVDKDSLEHAYLTYKFRFSTRGE